VFRGLAGLFTVHFRVCEVEEGGGQVAAADLSRLESGCMSPLTTCFQL